MLISLALLFLIAQKEMIFMVINDFVLPQTRNIKLFPRALQTSASVNDTISYHQLLFCFPFLSVWPPDLLLFVFLCKCFLAPLGFIIFPPVAVN